MSGWIATGISIVGFGSNFVPVKKFETGDGIFFQWVLCTAVWVVGCIVNLARTNFDQNSNHLLATIEFYPFAMLGGALWCIGNAMAVTIIKCIGLGLGMCLWGSVNLLLGWASGNFGLFGLTAQPAPHPILNYVGVGLAVVGAAMFTMIESDTKSDPKPREDEKYLLADPYRASALNHPLSVNETPTGTPTNESFIDKLPPTQKRILGIMLAFISGAFYGGNFNPPTYIIDRTGASGLDFVFSHFTGIFLTSTLIFAIYCAINKNKPVIYPQAVLPGMLSGLLWAIAQCSWFVANEKLSLTVSFPLISTGPGLVASLWGVIVFKEIKGTKNFIFLGLGFVIVGIAVTLIALSKTS